MTLTTKRLILRPWKESDAESLYEYAKNPNVGPIAGWPVHTSVEDSREIIREVLAVDETYAVTLKGDDGASTDAAIGSVGLLIGQKSNINTIQLKDDEAEIGYWIGEAFWGQGLIPEAVHELMRYAFEDLNMSQLWCGYFEENEKSKRVNEKCGFRYHHTELEKYLPLLRIKKTLIVTRIKKEDWQKNCGNSK